MGDGMKQKQRNITLDIIRLVALFCVVGVHFFYNSGFYNLNVSGIKMLIMIFAQSFFLICVPLFIILTGYLQNKKELKDGYYKGLKKILIIYFVFSLFFSVFVKFYLGKPMNLKIFIFNLLRFKGSKYGWYIEMYIGLFLLIPFLNLIFNNLNQKNTKKLIGTMLILVGIPCVLNIFNFDSFSWWKQPSISNEYSKIFPAYWTGLYPLMYYFIGAYLSKYEVKISTKKNILYLLLSIILFGLFNYYRSYGAKYIFSTWNDYSSLFVFIIAVLTFNLLLKIKINNPSKKTEYLFKLTTDSVLGAYLISAMFDLYVYKKLARLVPHIRDRFVYAPVTVLIVFVASLLLSIFVELIYRLITKKTI